MEKTFKEWLEIAFSAGTIAGYWDCDHAGCRENNGYFRFDEWLDYLEREGIAISDENGNCIKPAVSSSVCDEFGNEICLKCYPPFPECDKCPHQPKKQTDC